MSYEFERSGALASIDSYPPWLQDVITTTEPFKKKVVNHEFFRLMRDGELSRDAMTEFLTAGWLIAASTPDYLAASLARLHNEQAKAYKRATDYLVDSIYMEQKSVIAWEAWAQVYGLTRTVLKRKRYSGSAAALHHWCWYVSEKCSTPVAVAAIGVALGNSSVEWAQNICSKKIYRGSIRIDNQRTAMQWLETRASSCGSYWQALDTISTIIGRVPTRRTKVEIEHAIRASYSFMENALDEAMQIKDDKPMFFDSAVESEQGAQVIYFGPR